jgi:stringent starvation protein B
LPPKKDLALALLQESSVFIHLDPRKPEVIVPPYFKKQPQLVLQVGLNMAVNIPDLTVDDEGVSCTLSFNRTPFWCRLPWTAVYALVGEDHQGMIWPDEVPPEVSAAQREKAPDQSEAKGPRARAARGGKTRRKVEAVPDRAASKSDATSPSSSSEGAGEAASPAARSLGPLPVSVGPAPVARSLGAPPNKGSSDAPKPGKRELPPYLRVVK